MTTDPLGTIYRAFLGDADSSGDACSVSEFLEWLDPQLRMTALSDPAIAEATVCRYRSERAATGATIWELGHIDRALVGFYRWLGVEIDVRLLVVPGTRLPIVPIPAERLEALMTTVARFGAEVEAAARLLAGGLWISEVAVLRPEDLRSDARGLVAEIRLPDWPHRDVPLGPLCSIALEACLRLPPRFLFSAGRETTEQRLASWCRGLFTESGAGKFKHKALRRTWIHRLLAAGMDLSVVALLSDGVPLPPHACILPGEEDPFAYVAAVEPKGSVAASFPRTRRRG